MNRTDKGFSLIELIVSFAILGVVSLMVLSFTSATAGTYRTVSNDVGIQYEAQLAMGQLQEYLIDCSGGICTQGDSLYIVSQGESGGFVAHRFTYSAADRALYYSTGEVTGSGTSVACTLSADYLLAKDMDAFGVSAATRGDRTTVTVSFRFSRGSKQYSSEQTIFVRNEIQTATTSEALLQMVCA